MKSDVVAVALDVLNVTLVNMIDANEVVHAES
jgi:hypothetical protein